MSFLQFELIDDPYDIRKRNWQKWYQWYSVVICVKCCWELHQYLKLELYSVALTLSCFVSPSLTAFPCSPLECHQLSSMAADLEPDTWRGISLPCVSVCGAQSTCLRPETRKSPIASAPCLKSLLRCPLPSCCCTHQTTEGWEAAGRFQNCMVRTLSFICDTVFPHLLLILCIVSIIIIFLPPVYSLALQTVLLLSARKSFNLNLFGMLLFLKTIEDLKKNNTVNYNGKLKKQKHPPPKKKQKIQLQF